MKDGEMMANQTFEHMMDRYLQDNESVICTISRKEGELYVQTFQQYEVCMRFEPQLTEQLKNKIPTLSYVRRIERKGGFFGHSVLYEALVDISSTYMMSISLIVEKQHSICQHVKVQYHAYSFSEHRRLWIERVYKEKGNEEKIALLNGVLDPFYSALIALPDYRLHHATGTLDLPL